MLDNLITYYEINNSPDISNEHDILSADKLISLNII